MSVQPMRHRFTVDEYERMGEAGLFGEDDRIELVEGEIVEMAPIGSRHAACVDRLTRVLTARLGDRAIVRVQSPVRLLERSEPQPDVTLLRPRADFYAAEHPRPADTLLVIEVADASATWDRDVKARLYARAGVPETWVVDLVAGVVDVMRRPRPDGYGETHRRAPGERIEAAGVSVEVDEFLGSPA